MMLDPLSALSLAGNVLQFLDFTSNIISKGREIYNSSSGSLIVNDELGMIANDLVAISKRLKTSMLPVSNIPTLSADERALETVAEKCTAIGQELLEALESLNRPGKKKKWRSLYQALKAVWSQDKIDGISARLSSFREELELHLLVSMKEQIDFRALQQNERFDSLDESAQFILKHMKEKYADIESHLHNQTKELQRLHRDSDLRLIEEHEKTRLEIRAAVHQLRSGPAPVVPMEELSDDDDEEGALDEEREMIKVLESLWFDSISDRYDDIAKAHKTTFEWIFREPDPKLRPWSDFVQWLEDGDGVYWITGKPGSGKSTLMKFLYTSPQTKMILNDCSQDQDVIFGSFFLWNSGIRAQKTHESLLRSLLYPVLKGFPELIPIVLHEKIIIAKQEQAAKRLDHWPLLPWSLGQLKRAFDTLISQQEFAIKLFFAIDGLDEYEGNHGMVAKWIRDTASPSVKIIVSSRPWNVFLDVFNDMPRLRLQDLTYNDISVYVDDHLSKNERMRFLMDRSADQARTLTEEIVSKSSGVFLWVSIVVDSLLDGLRNYDKISDLQARLTQLPEDLEELYEVILLRADPMYQRNRSRYFLMIQAVRKICDELPLTVAFSLADEEDPKFCLTAPVELMTRGEALDRCEAMERRLAASCAGLLEVDFRQKPELNDLERARPLCMNDYYRTAYGSKIQFLHRSVKDFVEDPKRFARIKEDAALDSFDEYSALLRAWILRAKLLPLNIVRQEPGAANLWSVIEQTKELGRLSTEEKEVKRELMYEFDRTAQILRSPTRNLRIEGPNIPVEPTVKAQHMRASIPSKGAPPDIHQIRQGKSTSNIFTKMLNCFSCDF